MLCGEFSIMAILRAFTICAALLSFSLQWPDFLSNGRIAPYVW